MRCRTFVEFKIKMLHISNKKKIGEADGLNRLEFKNVLHPACCDSNRGAFGWK